MQETRQIAGDGYYRQLLESIKGRPSPAVKQIELDLLRTLPNNKHYEKLDADGASLNFLNSFILERFFECRKNKTKVITLANRNRCQQHNEPIRTRSKCM